jgi:hypothetical protein
MLRWVLIQCFAKGIPPNFSNITATIEKLDSAATWRGPWKQGQHCIMPAPPSMRGTSTPKTKGIRS